MNESLRVVIATLNSQYIHSSLAPWCLLAGVRAFGGETDVCVLEGTINEPLEQAAARIAAHRPAVLGLCCYIWNITRTLTLAGRLKELLPGLRVVLGGPEVSYRAAALLESEPSVDFILSGEGELPFALLLNALRRHEELPGLPGLCLRTADGIVCAPPYTPDTPPPSPYCPEYFAALSGRIAYLETSRGCPFSCAFCLSGRCGGARFFPLDRAKRELLLLANSGAKTIKLVDRTFNANPARAREIFRFLLAHYGIDIPQGVCFHFEIAGDLLDAETLALLAGAPPGAIQMEIGLQSFHAETLSAIRRTTDLARLTRNIQTLLTPRNIHVHLDLIAGLPLEGWDSFAESFNAVYRLAPQMLQLGFLKLLHGAPMREEPAQFPCLYRPAPPYEVLETPWLSAQELTALHGIEQALDRLYNSGRFRRTLALLLCRCGCTPFELFAKISGEFSPDELCRIPLNDYTALLLTRLSRWPAPGRAALRDAMVCDRLATNSSGRLPPCLQRPDPALGQARAALDRTPRTCRPAGIKRGLALLQTRPCVVYADYRDKDPVSGEYPLHFQDL